MTKNMEATLLAHEAVLQVLFRTIPNAGSAQRPFDEICAEVERNLNKNGTPESAQLAKDFHTEWFRLARLIPRS